MKQHFARATFVVAACIAATGCARVFHSYDLAPNGLTKTEDHWRTMLATGRGDSVASRVSRASKDAPGDELLRLLYSGTAAHYAGDYVHSNEFLEAAAAVADDRVTKSLSRSALSLITNDGVLPFAPTPSERLLIPYFAALNYIQLGRMEDAAVEARRLSSLLAHDDKKPTDYSDDVRRLRATMHSFAASIFEATGNRNDALVSYRNAAAFGASVDTAALTDETLVSDSSGTVIVLLEDGFVAHRIEQNLFVWLGPDELNAFSTGGAPEDRSRTATSVANRVVHEAFGDNRSWRDRSRTRGRNTFYVPLPPDQQVSHRPRHECKDDEPAKDDDARRDTSKVTRLGNRNHGPASPRRDRRAECEDHDVPYLLKVAWPVYSSEPTASNALIVADADTVKAGFADLSGAIVSDYGSQLPLVVARTIARGAAKAALAESAKRKASEKNEGLGKLVGLLGNVGNVLLERADTRSWHLLPGSLAVVRLHVKPGTQTLHANVSGRNVDIGQATVRPGVISFVTKRVY